MPTARQQAAFGLLPAERLIWDGHAGGGGGLGALGALGGAGGADSAAMAEQALMDAIEVCLCLCVPACMCFASVFFVYRDYCTL